MSNPKVYVTLQQFCEDEDMPRRLLLDAGFEVEQNTLGRRLRYEELDGALKGATAVLAGVELYDRRLLEKLPELRCISRCGVGTDTIDLDAARALNIAVYKTADEIIEPVAQMTLAMILALLRNLFVNLQDFSAGAWKKRSGFLLGECPVGLIGFGRIGRRVAEVLSFFGCKILVCDPALNGQQLPVGVKHVNLEALLVESNVVSLHASRAAAEGALLGAEQFRLMKPGSYVVNTARGHLIDEAALYEAIREGHIAGAALDVFAQEPYSGLLSKLPQVIGTPHVSTLTRASRRAMEEKAARNIVHHCEGRAVSHAAALPDHKEASLGRA